MRMKRAMHMTINNISQEEIVSFESLQAAFQKPTMLLHFDAYLRLYADLDASIKGMNW
ncbi:hypothetical protein OnM2_033093 [Erysiphe neolycopersici]|uniref:Uncharacterized protein n=1 Tax=Erysiphe neolycopersici TaxID=212602 RepID=A0A420HYC8_9PEZI|nr:hypothetical protein OnM2_033093 [Erysiphe neolycopersici]